MMLDEHQQPDLGMLEHGNEAMVDHHSVHEHFDTHPSTGGCNLIVNYLPHDIDDLSLKGLFVEFGEIITTKVVTDRTTKKSLGYGFVKFAREDDAKMAIQRLNGFTIDHKCLKVSVARPPSLEIRNCKLYVTNLPKDYTEHDVVNLFKEFGEIIECRVLKDKNSRSNKGVAFVQFDNKTQANNALSLNGCQLEGSVRGLVVKYAEDQHKKREMSRLHNLTTHNVYRYLPPGTVPMNDVPVDAYHHQPAPRVHERSEVHPPAYYYPNMQMHAPPPPAVQHQHPAQQQQLLQQYESMPPQAPHSAPAAHQTSPRPPQHVTPPSPQPHHGLGGINAFLGQPLQHLQVPAVSVGMHSGGLPSPMGSVSPNHYLYQQQQLLHQHALATNIPTSPMMAAYSPRSGRGRGGGRGGRGFPEGTDLLVQSPQQAPQPQLGQQAQYGSWYGASPQQPQMSFMPGSSTGSLTLSSPTHAVYAQAHPRHMSGGVSLDFGAGMMSPLQQQQRAPVMQVMQHTQQGPHIVSPANTSQRMAPSHQLYAHPMGTVPMLQPSPYMSSNAHYYVDASRKVAPTATASGAGSVTLNVTNLPQNADVALLHEMFGPYGRILSAQIDVDVSAASGGAAAGAPGRVSVCSGRGRVNMANMAQAEQAMRAVNGLPRGPLGSPVQVSLAGGSPGK